MGFGSSPAPTPTPAARPERYEGVKAEEVQLGGTDTIGQAGKSKAALTRPRGGAVTASSAKSGVKV